MARIFYSLSGDSRGHLSRAEAVVPRMANHDFVFGGGGTVLEMRDKGYEVLELPMLRTIMKANNRCDLVASAAHLAKVGVTWGKTIKDLSRWLESWKPDLVINDYDIFSQLAAKRVGIPCVSLSHMHVVSHCRYDRFPGLALNRIATRTWIQTAMSNCSRYIVSSFYHLPPRDEQTTEIVPAILRPEVEAVCATPRDHALVYLPNCDPEIASRMLSRQSGKFIVYTRNPVSAGGNVIFKPFDRLSFLQDLADCRYVISSAGHSLLSEALHFGKPVLCLPTKGLFEQHLNAFQLQRLGYGMYIKQLEALPQLEHTFETRLEDMRTAIAARDHTGNDHVIKTLEAHIS